VVVPCLAALIVEAGAAARSCLASLFHAHSSFLPAVYALISQMATRRRRYDFANILAISSLGMKRAIPAWRYRLVTS
jgi:hypothetical protein